MDNISALDTHVTTSHKDLAQTVSRESLIQLSEQERPLDAAKTCELCNEELDSFKSYSRHVGRHQEDLALFVLPDRGLDADTDEEEGFGEDEKPEDAAGGSSDHARIDQEEGTGSFTRSPDSVSSDQGSLPDDEDEELLKTSAQNEARNNPEVGTPNQPKRGALTCNNCKIGGIICNGEKPCRQCTQVHLQCIYGPLWQPSRQDDKLGEQPAMDQGLSGLDPYLAALKQGSDESGVDVTNTPLVDSPDVEQQRIPISSLVESLGDHERGRKQAESSHPSPPFPRPLPIPVVPNDDDYHYRYDSSRNRDNDGWERHSYYDAEIDAEVHVERKVERREDGSEVITQRPIREDIDQDGLAHDDGARHDSGNPPPTSDSEARSGISNIRRADGSFETVETRESYPEDNRNRESFKATELGGDNLQDALGYSDGSQHPLDRYPYPSYDPYSRQPRTRHGPVFNSNDDDPENDEPLYGVDVNSEDGHQSTASFRAGGVPDFFRSMPNEDDDYDRGRRHFEG